MIDMIGLARIELEKHGIECIPLLIARNFTIDEIRKAVARMGKLELIDYAEKILLLI